MRLMISLSALLISVMFVQMGIGSLRPFDTISGQVLGFTPTQIGLVASGHFAGFLIGCVCSPFLVKRVGHSRAFAAMAGVAVMSIIAHPLHPDPYFWAFVRVFSGFAVAGCYTLIESWLQAKVTNNIRGRVFGVYRLVDLSGQLLANGMIAMLTPASYVSYNIVALVMCLSIMPLTLTQSKEPALPEQVSFQPLYAFSVSPLATLGVLVAGISTATFGSVGPLFASAVGLSLSQIALFLIMAILGGVCSQMPCGMLADRVSRRTVLFGLSVLATIISLVLTTDLAMQNVGLLPMAIVLSFLFGFSTFPIYSVCASHASDFVQPQDMLALSASLIFCYATGAIVSPLIAGWLIEVFAPYAIFTFISVAHFLLMLFTIYRNFVRPVVRRSKPTAYVPRTSLFIANILRGRRSKSQSQNASEY